MTNAKTCLWLDGDGREAAEFWTGLFDDSHVDRVVTLDGPDGSPVQVIEITLAGTHYMVMDAARPVGFTMASSVSVAVRDQAALDRAWEAILAAGGQAQECSWITDHHGLSFQILPESYWEYMASDDPAVPQRVAEALWTMGKVDVAAIDRAGRGQQG